MVHALTEANPFALPVDGLVRALPGTPERRKVDVLHAGEVGWPGGGGQDMLPAALLQGI